MPKIDKETRDIVLAWYELRKNKKKWSLRMAAQKLRIDWSLLKKIEDFDRAPSKDILGKMSTEILKNIAEQHRLMSTLI